MKRKHNGYYWTIRYTDENGMNNDYGNWETYEQAISYILEHAFELPNEVGRIIRTR